MIGLILQIFHGLSSRGVSEYVDGVSSKVTEDIDGAFIFGRFFN